MRFTQLVEQIERAERIRRHLWARIRRDDFAAWLSKNPRGEDPDLVLRMIPRDPIPYRELLDGYLKARYGIRVSPHGLVEFVRLDQEVARLIGDLPCQFYHHTRVDVAKRAEKMGLIIGKGRAGVFLTNLLDGPNVDAWMVNLTGKRATLVVRRKLTQVGPDGQPGRFVSRYIPPRDIVEVLKQ